MEPFAFGILGLHPWELLRYTLREFGHKVEGWQRAEDRARYGRAEMAVWILAPWTGKGSRLRPADLLGTVTRRDL